MTISQLLSRVSGFLLEPSGTVTAEPARSEARALLFQSHIFLIIAGATVLFAPGAVSVPMLFVFPVILVACCLTRTRYYFIGGWILLFSAYLHVSLVVFVYDVDNFFPFLTLSWTTVTLFTAATWMDARKVLLLILFQFVYTSLVTFISIQITFLIFAAWNSLNLFFSFTIIKTRQVLDKYIQELQNSNTNLESTVREKTAVLKNTLEDREELIRELYHRTKNNMQVLSSLLHLKAAATSNLEVKDVLEDTRSRILSMALVHEKLYQSDNLRKIDLGIYVYALVAEIGKVYERRKSSFSLSVDIHSITVDLDHAVPLGLVFHELCTNSFKYAAVEGKTLSLKISGSTTPEGSLSLMFRDNGEGYSCALPVKTLGLTIISNVIEKQLQGTVSFYTNKGAQTDIVIPSAAG